MDQPPDNDRRAHDRARDARLVARLRAGDERAFGEIYDAWFDRVYDLARRIVRDDEGAADVAQDTFLNAWRRIDGLQDPAALGGWLLRIARNRALNVVERTGRSVEVDDQTFLAIEAGGVPVSGPDGFRLAGAAEHRDPAEIVQDGEVAALLWSAADALGERDRTVLDLHLRHGLTPAEIGEVVGVNRNAANQLIHRVRSRLDGAVRARLLWRRDGGGCEVLRALLADAGVDRFDSRAVTITNRHAGGCDTCGDRQRVALQPAALFGALPIVVAPVAAKQQAAAALAAEGVPMGGSGWAGPAPDGAGGPADPATADPDGAGGTADPATGSPADVGDHSPSGGTGASGPTPATSGPAPAPPPRTPPAAGRRRLLVGAAAIAVVAVAAIAVGLLAGRDGGDRTAAGPDLATDTTPPEDPGPTAATTATVPGPTGRATTTVASTTSEPPSATTDGPGTTTTGEDRAGPPADVPPPLAPAPPPTEPPPAAPPPAGPAPTTTTTTTPAPPPPTATATIAVVPTSHQGDPPYFAFDEGIPRLTWSATGGVQVEVTGPGFSSTARTGDAVVCPGTPTPWSVCLPPTGTYRYQIRVIGPDGQDLVRRSAFLTIT